MDPVKYSKACTEVVTVLEHLPKEYYEKVPFEKICFYKYKMDINYTYEYDPEHKNLSEYAIGILMNLYRDYWATEEKRKEILEKEAKERLKIENKKREFYSPNNIFSNKEKNVSGEEFKKNINTTTKSNATKEIETVTKLTIIQKIIRKIKSIIKEKK